ncbi:PadR family transcriptional regulator [Tengunoibacter tsumagoiensis]|uniref:PadR family transcriptional regulator n=1 Tax=Tengunoibacter tsumagoiensis TaxID=2014871 RepID=A0A402A4C0_9CHLR|nr:PadR family transcriptional regulator [Tengunoibacter tsumagoiensis]GCE14004.1 hypothetical protein KTT_38630 [Tengunoibacter tsumagoiensis]
MYKQLMLLGLLLARPMYGQQIREVIETHHELFANHIKKPTIYYQLEKLVADGYLDLRREAVEAPGPGAAHEDVTLRERDMYYITAEGRSYFYTLLRSMLSTYAPGFSELEACIYFLNHLTPEEAETLLRERLENLLNQKTDLLQQTEGCQGTDIAHQLVYGHKLALLEAEINWLEKTLRQLPTTYAMFLHSHQ